MPIRESQVVNFCITTDKAVVLKFRAVASRLRCTHRVIFSIAMADFLEKHKNTLASDFSNDLHRYPDVFT